MNKKDEIKNSKTKDIDRIERTDWFLQDMVDIVNSNHVSFGIVLNVKGLIISGLLIGGKDYFKGFAEDFSLSLKDGEAKESIEKNLSNYGNMIYDKKEEKDDIPRKPQYIHLKKARFEVKVVQFQLSQ